MSVGLQVAFGVLMIGWSITLVVLNAILLTKVSKIANQFQSTMDNWKSDYIIGASYYGAASCPSGDNLY